MSVKRSLVRAFTLAPSSLNLAQSRRAATTPSGTAPSTNAVNADRAAIVPHAHLVALGDAARLRVHAGAFPGAGWSALPSCDARRDSQRSSSCSCRLCARATPADSASRLHPIATQPAARIRQRVQPLRCQRFRIELDLARRRWERPDVYGRNGCVSGSRWKRKRECPSRPRSSNVMCSMPGFVEWPSAPIASACSDDFFRRVAETSFGESHALRKLPKEPHIRSRFAWRLNGLLRELHKVVPVRALNVGVLEKRRRRQNVIGVIRGVGEEQVVHHGEQIRPRQAAPHRVLVRRDRAGIRVVDKQRVHRRPSPVLRITSIRLTFAFSACAQRRHIHHARQAAQRRSQREIRPLRLLSCST